MKSMHVYRHVGQGPHTAPRHPPPRAPTSLNSGQENFLINFSNRGSCGSWKDRPHRGLAPVHGQAKAVKGAGRLHPLVRQVVDREDAAAVAVNTIPTIQP
jgi:hypothetical protein